MTQRQILESQKMMSSSALGDISEEILALLKAAKYEQVEAKCQKMTMSKQKYMVLCSAYLGLKQWKRLIQSCDRGLQYDINEPEFYNLKGKSMGKLGKHHEKVLLLQTAIALNPANPSYYRNLGSAYYNLQNYELAIEKYDKAIQLQPGNLLNYHNKGSALLKCDKVQQARSCYKIALDLNPNLALSYSGLGDCEKQLGNLEQSQRMYQKAYQISGKDVYKQEMQGLEREKRLQQYHGSWLYGLAWLKNKVF